MYTLYAILICKGRVRSAVRRSYFQLYHSRASPKYHSKAGIFSYTIIIPPKHLMVRLLPLIAPSAPSRPNCRAFVLKATGRMDEQRRLTAALDEKGRLTAALDERWWLEQWLREASFLLSSSRPRRVPGWGRGRVRRRRAPQCRQRYHRVTRAAASVPPPRPHRAPLSLSASPPSPPLVPSLPFKQH
jgi:hypothetical protein